MLFFQRWVVLFSAIFYCFVCAKVDRVSETEIECGEADLVTELKRSCFKFSGLIATAALALIGHLTGSWLNARSARKTAELERLQTQIEHFFGPIGGKLFSTTGAFDALMTRYEAFQDAVFQDAEDENVTASFFKQFGKNQKHGVVSEDDKHLRQMWTGFVEEIAYPMNKEIRELLASKAHLVDGSYPDWMNVVFKLVAEREMMISAWKSDDYRILIPKISFPKEADAWFKDKLRLKIARKNQLLGLVQGIEVVEEAEEPVQTERRLQTKHYTQHFQGYAQMRHSVVPLPDEEKEME